MSAETSGNQAEQSSDGVRRRSITDWYRPRKSSQQEHLFGITIIAPISPMIQMPVDGTKTNIKKKALLPVLDVAIIFWMKKGMCPIQKATACITIDA